ncbi:hypothetical protein K0M31_002753 [Melipona bicolor]|uniref:Uncharacterized protein n=1 Tax=Melipona bicolor TaxID=60889 RepID=A0AA40FZU0_9HYME|nr:hypothetical protein K0M31_002753 [Melipona bicolor]
MVERIKGHNGKLGHSRLCICSNVRLNPPVESAPCAGNPSEAGSQCQSKHVTFTREWLQILEEMVRQARIFKLARINFNLAGACDLTSVTHSLNLVLNIRQRETRAKGINW